ncbi:MAG: hypothetical protein AB1762_10365 [Gemmatimonadota bacterium]
MKGSWSISLGALLVMLLAPGAARAQGQQMKAPPGRDVTVTGTVIDVSCKFGQGLTGADHRMCAQVCGDKGIPLAILGTDGKLYIPTSSAMPGEPQNGRLKEHAERKVTVRGKVFDAGGAQAIQITSITAS